jgi:hypothetical protein
VSTGGALVVQRFGSAMVRTGLILYILFGLIVYTSDWFQHPGGCLAVHGDD